MIMVILGAGASYDSIPSRLPPLDGSDQWPDRPPLAGQLFSHKLSDDCLSRFPQCHPIVPYLQAIPPDSSVEHILESLRAEGDTDPDRKRQIAAIRYYLQFLIVKCEYDWMPAPPSQITNYVTLLDQLRRSGKRVVLVTFNCDRLIEHALISRGVLISDFTNYISNDQIKLIKLHGSVNWGREVETEVDNIQERTVWDVMQTLIERAGEIQISDRFRIIDQHPIGKTDNGIPLVPAISIPVEIKTNFECPESHLNCLRGLVRSVTKLLVVGWRAAEDHFLKLLRQEGLGDVSAQIVADNRKNAEQVLQRLKGAGITLRGDPMDDEGFSRYVISRKAEQFFAS